MYQVAKNGVSSKLESAHTWWLFRGTMINNGSTLMNDIDLRRYYYIERNHSTSMAASDLAATAESQQTSQPSSNVSPQYDHLLNEDHMGATTTGMTYINRTLLSPRSKQIMQYLVTMLIFRFQWWSKLDTIWLFQCIRSRSCTCLWRVWRTTGPSPAWPPIGRGQQQQTSLFTSSYPCHQSHLRQAI